MSTGLFDRLSLDLPGHWIEMEDRDLAFEIRHLLGMAVDQHNEAVLACELFMPLHTQRIGVRAADTNAATDPRVSTLVTMYAKAFVYSLDATRAFLCVLAARPGAPAPTVAACAEFQAAFGYVREIRNSLQHIEERAIGLGRNKKRLNTHFLVLGAYIGNRFGVTTADSLYVDMEVSEATLQRAKNLLEEVIWSLSWRAAGNLPIARPEGQGA